MLDSLTIISKGGLVLYQQNHTDAPTISILVRINDIISTIFLDPTKALLTRTTVSATEGAVVAEWNMNTQYVVIAFYPHIMRHAKRIPWLLDQVLKEFGRAQGDDQEQVFHASLFDTTYHVLLKQAFMAQQQQQQLPRDTTIEGTVVAKPRGMATKGKEKRHWGEGKVTKEAMAELDFSKDTSDGDGNDANALAEARAAYLPNGNDNIEAAPEMDEEEIIRDDSSWGTGLYGLLDQMTGNKILNEADLSSPLLEMQQLLLSKNVASDICRDIITTVQKSLVGKRLQSFARVKTAVRQALESAIAKILAPPQQRNVDILRGIVSKRNGRFFATQKKEPYVICMVGINGVGKSTSLAKIAYYLKQHDCSPMLAACDTFRSGAVEQLNVHAKCLDIPLYHKGYAKDPSAVATAAIAHATQEGYDVVLVDTAGRMQNNVPLMKALSKLVVENKPDLVLFVCEALVGNDGIDQLTMFNKALRSGGHSRQIDGIILTKFDTVSDKVGAALTLTHVTGAPVVFCGTGQKYNHLKKLSAATVIKSLFA